MDYPAEFHLHTNFLLPVKVAKKGFVTKLKSLWVSFRPPPASKMAQRVVCLIYVVAR
ncbi:MAG: hypothetical protein LBH84_04805 [Prevotellaceae bacterium]|nr:hypothetical protein [Prevotellaceae bacterium]